MNNLKELKEQYSKTQEELTKLGEQIEKQENKNKNKRLRVDKYIMYYFKNVSGNIASCADVYDNIDNYHYNSGNYYLTAEDCQKAIDVKNTEIELRNLAEELNNGEEINWNDSCQNKYSITYNYTSKNINFICTLCEKLPNLIFCLDRDFKDKAIERIGEDKLKEMLTYEQI